ncbi:cupin domain-containing protein [Candidatus Riflebacteria bacterium]
MFTKCHYDFKSLNWLNNPRKNLNLQAVALGLIRLPPGEGYSFTHQHREQEEVYIVIEGEGELLINDEIHKLEAGDLFRVAPEAKRALRAMPGNELFVICAGGVPAGYPKNKNGRYSIDDGIPDYDDIPPWYRGEEEIEKRNARLKERMERARARRKL